MSVADECPTRWTRKVTRSMCFFFQVNNTDRHWIFCFFFAARSVARRTIPAQRQDQTAARADEGDQRTQRRRRGPAARLGRLHGPRGGHRPQEPAGRHARTAAGRSLLPAPLPPRQSVPQSFIFFRLSLTVASFGCRVPGARDDEDRLDDLTLLLLMLLQRWSSGSGRSAACRCWCCCCPTRTPTCCATCCVCCTASPSTPTPTRWTPSTSAPWWRPTSSARARSAQSRLVSTGIGLDF